MLYFIPPVLGILVFFGTAFLLSEKRGAIHWRPVIFGLVILVLLAFFFHRTKPGMSVHEAGNVSISVLLRSSEAGIQSLVSPKWMENELCCAAFSVVPPIIFIGALTAILFHLGIMQAVIRCFAKIVSKTMGISGSEAVIAVANIFLGMCEAPFAVRPYLAKFTRSEIFCMMTCGMSTIAGGVMVAYAGMLQKAGMAPGHLFIASILAVFSSVLYAKIMLPETETPLGLDKNVKDEKQDVNLIDAACRGASEATHLAVNVIGILIAFTALITFANLCLGVLGEWGDAPVTLQRIFAWFFAPVAWLLGIPWSECSFAGQLLGEKTVLNEFVAYLDMTNPQNLSCLSDRSRIIMTYALCGFANFGSLAIMLGGIGTLIPERRKEVAELAWRSLVSGTLSAFTTACFTALFV